MNEVYGIVYCATNVVNEKKYIGQTIRGLNRRKSEHISQSKNGSGFLFHNALSKHGEHNFEWSILDTAENSKELDEKETQWIKFYNTFGTGGYNLSVGGQFYKDSNMDSEKMSQINGGKEFLIFDIEGNFLGSRYSQTAFAKEIGVVIQSVNNVLNGNKVMVKERILFFKDTFTDEILQERLKRIRDWKKPFVVFDKYDNYLGTWTNKTHCGKEIGIGKRTIQEQLASYIPRPRKYRVFYLDSIPEDYKSKIKDVI